MIGLVCVWKGVSQRYVNPAPLTRAYAAGAE